MKRNDEQARDLLLTMRRIRRVEEALAERYPEQEMRCPMHLCIGQEATAAGVCSALRNEDWVFSNHRAHGHYLAKGGDLGALVAELYGRETGCAGGRGGSMHLIDPAAGFMGATPIVGGTVPVAVGAAWAAKLQGIARVVAVFFGDGCFEEGVLHESLNFAALHRLPVLFVCENNGLSVFTRLEERQPERRIVDVVSGHGIVAEQVDGNDALAVAATAKRAVDGLRAGNGPTFLELMTHRWVEHCGPYDDDHLGYRAPGELAAWKAKCPIARLERQVMASGLSREQLDAQEASIGREVDSAFAFALSSAVPEPATMASGVYADES